MGFYAFRSITQEEKSANKGKESPFFRYGYENSSMLGNGLEKVSMKSQFPFRSEFEESLNIYPNKLFSLKLEGFLGLLGALAILGSC